MTGARGASTTHARPGGRAVHLVLAYALALGPAATFAAPAQPDRAAITAAKAIVNTPATTLGAADVARFRLGEAAFNTPFESASTAPAQRAGLGPRFNAPSCDACHNGGGRGGPPGEGESPFQAVVHAATRPVPGVAFGSTPLRLQAVAGATPDAHARVAWQEMPGRYPDGAPYSLRRPLVTLRDGRAELGELGAAALRIPNALLGLGLLDAVDDATIAAGADPRDRDRDGVRGRVHWVRDADGRRRAGRFGWKATQPTLLAQTAFAYAREMGVKSRWDAPPEAGPRDPVEIADELVLAIVAFQRDAAEPPSRAPRPDARAAELFRAHGCSACHRETLRTGATPGRPWLEHVEFRAYTDLLLHDLGPDLAAPARDGDAAPGEWRTAPLWGLGRVGTLSRHRVYLHDGRARSAEEAILWHGGEAAAARARFQSAPADDRARLLEFLEGL